MINGLKENSWSEYMYALLNKISVTLLCYWFPYILFVVVIEVIVVITVIIIILKNTV
jgi:hypothetical protein